MVSALHLARLDAVVGALCASGARSVADLGCGSGELLLRLRDMDQFTRLIGIDIDTQALALARANLGLDLLRPDARLCVGLGSFEEVDCGVSAVDAAVMLETIEHIDPGRLPRVERSVFRQLRPQTVIVTTPNRDYNVLHGMSDGQRRHPGHRFEWTRAQFAAWCAAVAQRCGYRVHFSAIGPADPYRGSSTQMACFVRA